MALIIIVVSDTKFYFSEPNFIQISETSSNEIRNNIDKIFRDQSKNDFVICVHRKSYPYLKKYSRYLPLLPFHHERGHEVYSSLEKRDVEYFQSILQEFIKQEILLPFIPLHLSLQAFWGVTINDINEHTKKITFAYIFEKNIIEKSKKIEFEIIKRVSEKIQIPTNPDYFHPAYHKLFPNPKAFQLVKEAQYDFYAPLINFVLTDGQKGIENGFKSNTFINDDEEDIEQWDYEKPSFLELLKKIGDSKLESIIEALKIENDKTSEGNHILFFLPQLEQQKNISISYFIDCLKEICAILANTPIEISTQKPIISFNKQQKYFGYKGKNIDKLQKILQKLAPSFENDLVENDSLKFHSKLLSEIIIEKKSNSQFDYSIFARQLINWGLDKSMVVIAGIECLSNMINYDF